MGVVKNLIDNEPELTTEQKKELHDELIEFYKLEIADRDSARKREVEKAKTGGFDLMFNLTGIIGFVRFCFYYLRNCLFANTGIKQGSLDSFNWYL